MKKPIKLRTLASYPCQWDDIIDEKNHAILTVYTLKEAKKDEKKEGISQGEGGVYDIVLNVPHINKSDIKKALKHLSLITKEDYFLSN